ncbi:unnamed protein product [Effrenium voratum]|nr:unnamed protein product [Effrenium voratum]
MGVLEVVVGDVQRVLPAAVQVAEASGLRELPCQVLVKCLGWDHSPHKALDGVLQLQRLRGFWVDGDCRRFVFKFSSNSTGARSLSTLSFFVLLSSAMDAFFHFLTRPAELEEMLDNLPTATTLGEDLGATFVGRTLLALHGLSAPLCRAAAEAARRKSAGILEVHPAERFLEELAAEWRQYSAEVAQSYPYALTDVRQMLEERQRVARDLEAKAPPSARSAGAMSLEALRTKILTAARRALGAENLVADTPLLDLGLDSLAQIDLRQSLAALNLRLSAAELFDFPTVDALARHLSQVPAEAVEPEARTPKIESKQIEAEPKVLVPPHWFDVRARLLFLHGARCDAAVTQRLLEATGWQRSDLFDIALVNAPHADRADAQLFEGPTRLGWYDPAGSYFQWGLPQSDADSRWATSLSLISHVWREWGPFDGIAGICEGAAAAALAALQGLQPLPRFLVSIGGYAAEAPEFQSLYQRPAGIPSLHLVGREEAAPAQAFPGLPCWCSSDSVPLQQEIAGAHRLPELAPLAPLLQRFLRRRGNRAPQAGPDPADSAGPPEPSQCARPEPAVPSPMEEVLLQAEVLQSMARASPRQRQQCLAAAELLQRGEAAPLAAAPFLELGLGSLEWMLMRQSLSQALGLRIPSQLIFEGPTVQALSQKLLQLQREAAAAAVTGRALEAAPASAPAKPKPAIEATAVIAAGAVIREDVTLGAGCHIGEFAIVGPRVVLGPNCRVAAMAVVEADVTLGADCEVCCRALVRGPLTAGARCRFEEAAVIGGHSSHQGATRNGSIRIGDDCIFELGSVVLAPRGDAGVSGVTAIGNGVVVHMKGEVSHDCVLEDGVFLNGELAGFCHIMAHAKVGKGAVFHQFTTLGSGAFCAMLTKVRFDVLPFCVFDEHVLLVDRVALARDGRSAQEADELDAFYSRHFSSQAAAYIQSLDGILSDAEGAWYSAEVRRFFQIRGSMRDRRLLARYGEREQ